MNTPTRRKEEGATSSGTPAPAAMASNIQSPCNATAGETATSRGRALTVQHHREVTCATVKEVDVVRRGLRCVETRMHQLESRVQHVNPWVVQHMWETLCALRLKFNSKSGGSTDSGVMEEPLVRDGKPSSSLTTMMAATRRSLPLSRGGTPISKEPGKEGIIQFCGDHLIGGISPNTLASSEGEVDSLKSCNTGPAKIWEGHSTSAASSGMQWQSRRQSLARSVVNVVRQLPSIDSQWQCWRFEQEECVARQRLVLDENTDRGALYAHLTCSLASTFFSNARFRNDEMWVTRHQREERQYGGKRGKAARGALFAGAGGNSDDEDLELSSISACDGWRHRDNDPFSNEAGMKLDCIVQALLKNKVFVDQLTSSVSQKLAALIQQKDIRDGGETPLQGRLPSALLLAIQEAIENLATTHHQAIFQKQQEYAEQQQEQHKIHEQRLLESVAEHEKSWSLLAARVSATGSEMLEQQQRFLAQGREDAKLCSDVRKELLALCSEVLLAAERIPSVELAAPTHDIVNSVVCQSSERCSTDCDATETRLEMLCNSVAQVQEQLEGLRLKTNALETFSEINIPTSSGVGCYQRQEERLASLQRVVEGMQQTVGMLVRKAEVRVGSSTAPTIESKEFNECIKAQKELERKLEQLTRDLHAAPRIPPHQPGDRSDVCSASLFNHSDLMSVEDAMLDAQRVIMARRVERESSSCVCVEVLSALCTTLQEISHLYNRSTGTFGYSLQLIFAMPPLHLPSEVAFLCRAYLRKHTIAELEEALWVLGIGKDVGKVFCNCYHWIQSHVLVFFSSVVDGRPLCDAVATAVTANSTSTSENGPRVTVPVHNNGPFYDRRPTPRVPTGATAYATHSQTCRCTHPQDLLFSVGCSDVPVSDYSHPRTDVQFSTAPPPNTQAENSVFSTMTKSQRLEQKTKPQQEPVGSSANSLMGESYERLCLETSSIPRVPTPLTGCSSTTRVGEILPVGALRQRDHQSVGLLSHGRGCAGSQAGHGANTECHIARLANGVVVEYPDVVAQSANCPHNGVEKRERKQRMKGWERFLPTPAKTDGFPATPIA